MTDVGALNMAGGAVNLNGGSPVSATSFTLNGGVLGGSDALTIGGLLNWLSGNIQGSGLVTLNGGLSVSGGFTNRLLSGRPMILAAGTGSVIGTGPYVGFGLQSGAVFTNQTVIEFTNSGYTPAGIGYGGSGTAVFNNNGIVRLQTGNTGSCSMGVTFNNTGTVEVLSATLSVGANGLAASSGSSASSYLVSAGATLEFAGPNALASGSTVSGAGSVRFVSGAVTIAGTYNIGTATQSNYSGTSGTFTGPIIDVGDVSTIGGTLNFNSPVADVGALNIAGRCGESQRRQPGQRHQLHVERRCAGWQRRADHRRIAQLAERQHPGQRPGDPQRRPERQRWLHRPPAERSADDPRRRHRQRHRQRTVRRLWTAERRLHQPDRARVHQQRLHALRDQRQRHRGVQQQRHPPSADRQHRHHRRRHDVQQHRHGGVVVGDVEPGQR